MKVLTKRGGFDSVATVLSFTALLIASTIAHATPMTMSFEGLQDFENVANFYNGGYGGNGSGPGPNYGVVFARGIYASIDADDGGSGNFGGEPSPHTAVSFQQNGGGMMNVASGFSGQLSFYYSNPNGHSTVYLYEGINGTGGLLASLFLPVSPYQGQLDPTGNLSPLLFTSLSFAGLAKSVDFGELAHRAYVDDITIGSIPEPSTVALFVLGLPIAIVFRRRIGIRPH